MPLISVSGAKTATVSFHSKEIIMCDINPCPARESLRQAIIDDMDADVRFDREVEEHEQIETHAHGTYDIDTYL